MRCSQVLTVTSLLQPSCTELDSGPVSSAQLSDTESPLSMPILLCQHHWEDKELSRRWKLGQTYVPRGSLLLTTPRVQCQAA